MIAISLLAAIALTQTAPPKPPPVDRSAELQLRRLFEEVSKVRPLHVRIYPAIRETAKGQSDQGSYNELWISDQGFRIESTSEWGQERFVCDGKTFMHDPLDDGDSIRLSQAEKLIFKNKGSQYSTPSVLLYMVEGSAGFAEAVQKDAPVIERTWPNGEKSIEFHIKDFGTVNVFPGSKGGPIDRLENCPLDLATKRFKDDPGDFPEPDPGMLTVERIEWLPMPKRVPPTLFDPTPPKGKKVEDLRK